MSGRGSTQTGVEFAIPDIAALQGDKCTPAWYKCKPKFWGEGDDITYFLLCFALLLCLHRCRATSALLPGTSVSLSSGARVMTSAAPATSARRRPRAARLAATCAHPSSHPSVARRASHVAASQAQSAARVSGRRGVRVGQRLRVQGRACS
jgi:hypothetical protein